MSNNESLSLVIPLLLLGFFAVIAIVIARGTIKAWKDSRDKKHLPKDLNREEKSDVSKHETKGS